MSRFPELLLLAADALEDGRDPFSDAFLVEHNVTADECFTLSDNLAFGARLYAQVVADLTSKKPLVSQNAAMYLASVINKNARTPDGS